jgi:hypothetical protein
MPPPLWRPDARSEVSFRRAVRAAPAGPAPRRQRAPPTRATNARRPQAVIALFSDFEHEPHLVITRRGSGVGRTLSADQRCSSSHRTAAVLQLKHHAGQLALCGGGYDEKTDATLMDTALREAREEVRPRLAGRCPPPVALTQIGLPGEEDELEIVGALDRSFVTPASNFRVVPFVGMIQARPRRAPPRPHPRERSPGRSHRSGPLPRGSPRG